LSPLAPAKKYKKMITVMLVDDHFVVRSGLAASLELETDMEVVAEAESGEEAISLYHSHIPQVVLMDLQLPKMNGIEAVEKLGDISTNVKILIFSTFARENEIQVALDAGASGYLQKSASRDELIGAIRTIASGGTYLPVGMADRLQTLQNTSAITARERQILELIAKGKANKEIGAVLGIAEDTVKRHVSNVLQKLGVHDRAQATAEAIRRGIVKV